MEGSLEAEIQEVTGKLMNRYLVDTSVIIEFLRGNKGWVEKLNDLKGEMSSSFVCLAELYEGITRDTKVGAESRVIKFFRSMTEVYGLDGRIAENFGRVRAGLRKSGEMIEDMDILVAATCMANNLTLVTKNTKHFARVKGLSLLTG